MCPPVLHRARGRPTAPISSAREEAATPRPRSAPSGTEPLGGISREELLLALDAAGAGTFHVDLETGELRWSPSLAALYGLAPEQAPNSFEQFFALIHPEDSERVRQAIRHALESGEPYEVHLRAVWPDGSAHWLQGAGRRVDDDESRPRALVGMARDISVERAALATSDEMRALVDALYAAAPVGLAFVDNDMRYVRINDAMARIGRQSVEEHLGRRIRDVLPAPLGEIVERHVAEARDGARIVLQDDIASQAGLPTSPDARHYTASYYPVPGAGGRPAGVGIVVSETTARVQADAARERTLARTRFLADVSAALDASLDYGETLRAVADLVVRSLADWCSIDMVTTGEAGAPGLENVAVAHVDPEKVAMARDLQRRYPPRLDAPTGAPNVALRTGEPELYPQITPELLERTGAEPEQVDLVRSLGLSSAMVVPLRARGRVLGAMTLVATEGRADYGPDDLAFAQEVAARAALAVDNARLYREAREQERRSEEARAILDTLIDQAPIGVAFIDRDGRFVRINATLAELHGGPAAEHVGRTVDELFGDFAPPIRGHFDQVLETGRPVADIEVTRPAPGDRERLDHFLVSYYPVRLPGGASLGVGATVVDMTPRVAAREELRAQRDLYGALLRAQSELGEAFALVDGERIVFVNEATQRLTARTADELYHLDSILELLPRDQQRPVGARLRDIRREVEATEPSFETEIVRPDGTRVAIEAAGRPLPGDGRDRLVVIARDITERRQQQAERERLLRTEQAARRASEAAHDRMRLLADASALLERALSNEESLQDVAELLVARLADSATIDVLARDGRIRRVGAAARVAGGDRLLAELAHANRLTGLADHPIQRAMRGQQATVVDDPVERHMGDVWRTAEELERHREAIGRSVVVVPLVARGRSVGALGLGWREEGRRPPREEWSLIEALAQRIALAVDSALQYQERAYVARTLQQSLLPGALPTIAGADVAAEYLAAGEGMEVGGDFFDVFAVGEQDEWALVIGDVCGKGAEAAAVTALARYTLRAVTTRSPSPAATLATLNEEMLRQMPEPRFLTAIIGHLQIAPDGGGRLTLASGGHLPALALRAGGTSEVAACAGMLLGVEPGARSEDCRVALAPGDAIVLYTDGITEARPDRPLAPAALAAALQPVLAEGAGAIARRAVAVAEEQAGGDLRDDVAVLVLQLTDR
ncbi:MAG TPA: PAS domain-containing protein [Solirubrobacteraceae bacterium]|nr:PAS domain-containing protein [Solirubrobacteraceae bacterium]